MSRFLIILVIMLLSGCVRDIARDSQYPTDYVVSGVYEVKQPLIAYRNSTPFDFLEPLPFTLYDAKTYPNARGQLIAPGTLVRITRLLRQKGSLGETTYWVRGIFVSGPLAGEPVELIFISIVREPPLVDTNMLKLVTKP